VKAVRLHKFHTAPDIDEVPDPKITGPLDVIVKIGGAGVCRTDLHIIEGQWDAAMGTPLPYILGHENAGWVHEVGCAAPAGQATTCTARTAPSPDFRGTAAWRSTC
jgi:NAD+-dependent secondary alcohol dehydrogenase Adh1